MKLKELIEQYIVYRKSLGEKFRTNSTYLKAFCNYLGNDICVSDIDSQKVDEFLYGDGDITSAWFIKHTALLGFYEYAISRKHINSSPLPKIFPQRPPAFVPYIYTKQEIRLLLDNALTYQTHKSHIVPHVVRTILLLLYCTGMRLRSCVKIT